MVILQLDQQPILIQAIFTGDVEEVRATLEFKPDVNCQDCERRSPLHAAVFKGSADVAALLLSFGARVNTKDSRWITPLHRACSCGSSELVALLLRYQADTTARDRHWQTPLHVAAANNAVECVEQLLECVPNCNVTDRMGRTAVHHAAVNGHKSVLELLLSKGCIVNACDKKDCRPIHCAAHMGHVDSIEFLLSNGADINAKDRNQYSPLHVAASSGMVSACRVLLRAGAEVDARNAYGNSPLHIACLNGHLPVCNVLVSFGANIEAINYRGQTPLHIAAASTHGVDCLNFLVDQKANINKQSLDGRSPLHMTAIHGRFTRSKTLIDRGAIVDCTDKNSCTALHIAAQYGHDILSNTLLMYGADPSKKGYSGRTPLHMSCLSGYVECCRKFLQAGVNLNAMDDSGKTPIHCAAYKGSVECLDLLVSNGADFQLLDNIGRTPLHYAAVQGHYPCVFTLVGLGSNVNLCDFEGCSPLHLAAAYDIKGECVEYLLRHKADPKLKDSKGYTPIHYAVSGGNLAGLGFLLSAVGNNYIMYGSDMPLTTPLHLAARNGNHDILQLLLPYFHDINIRTQRGSTALLLAAKAGNTHCVQMLLRYGAKVSITDNIQHMGPVHYSARNGHMHCLALLLDNAEDKNVIDMPDSLQRTPLMMAVAGGHTESANTLLKCGANANIVDAEKHSSLFRAVVNGQQNTVQLLLSNGAEVDKPDVHGKTVLHLAAQCGHLSSLQTVINTMDSLVVMALDNQGCTALHWACYNGNPNCVLFLLDKKIFKELEGNVFSPIHCATFVGAERCIELLCNSYGTDIVKLKDARNRTPLHIASLHGHVDCAKFLLEKGAEIDCKDADDRTPLVAAAQNGQSQIIDILLSNKADVTSYDNNGNTALHLACLKRHSHSALLLLENIDDPDVVNMINNDKKTPLHLSARNGLVNVTRQLISKGSSVLTVDVNGMTPALCCAPNTSVAQCLALILANYAICSQQSKEISFPSTLPVKRTASTSSSDFKQISQKTGHKKIKIYRVQESQTDMSLLRDPDFFECQKMCRRYNSPTRIKKKRPTEPTGAKAKKVYLKSDIPCSLLKTFRDEISQGTFQNIFQKDNKNENSSLENEANKETGRDLHHSYSDMLITPNMNRYSLETFNKIMYYAKTKKNLKGRDLKLSPQCEKFLYKNETKVSNQAEMHSKMFNCPEKQFMNATNKHLRQPAKEINHQNAKKVGNVAIGSKEDWAKLEKELAQELSLSFVQKNLLDRPEEDRMQETDTASGSGNEESQLNQIFEETMQEIIKQKQYLNSESSSKDCTPVRVQSEGKLKSKEFVSENSFRDNRMQKIWKTYANQISNKNLKCMIKLQQTKGQLNMQTSSEKLRSTELANVDLGEEASPKVKLEQSKTCDATDMVQKQKLDDAMPNCTPSTSNAGDNAVEEIYINSKKLQELPKPSVAAAPISKPRIIETASDDEIVKVDQVMQRELLLESIEVEKVYSCSKKLREKGHFSKQAEVDAHLDKFTQKFIREALKTMKSSKNLIHVSQHVHMLNMVLNKSPRNIPLAIDLMKHILATIQEHDWLEKLQSEILNSQGNSSENLIGVELFDQRYWDDIYKTTEELAMEMENFSNEEKNGLEHECAKDLRRSSKEKRKELEMEHNAEYSSPNITENDNSHEEKNRLEHECAKDRHRSSKEKRKELEMEHNAEYSSPNITENDNSHEEKNRFERECPKDLRRSSIKKIKELEMEHNAEYSRPNLTENDNKQNGINKSPGGNNLQGNSIESNKPTNIDAGANKKEVYKTEMLQDEDKNLLGLSDKPSLEIEVSNRHSDTVIYKPPKLAPFYTDSTTITFNVPLMNQSKAGSADSSNHKTGTCDTNVDLYNFLSPDKEIPFEGLETLIGNEQIDIKEDGQNNEAEEIVGNQGGASNQYLSGTISLVSHLSVQEELKLTLESVDDLLDTSSMKLQQKEQKLMQNFNDTISSIKTLYVNQNEGPQELTEAVKQDEPNQIEDEQTQQLSTIQEGGASSDIYEDEEEEVLIRQYNPNEETIIVMQESCSNETLDVEKCLKSGKKNINVKKKRLKPKESFQCCIS